MRVDKAARHSAALLVFPVYGAMELTALAGPEVANDLEASLHAVAARIAMRMQYMPIWYKCRVGHVLAGLGPATDALPGGTTRPVNRARLFDTDLDKIGIFDLL
ncbi:hypothetical protein [Tateyamaria sp.]|uniref:hypothetical protein n=1 Tax=Tateyamaria sp. TaxID=1929288 RepID=UPI00329AB050